MQMQNRLCWCAGALGKRRGGLGAQFWSFDIIFAVIIFSFAITILAFAWYNISNQLSFAYGNGAAIAQLQDSALSQRLMTAGSPAGWQGGIIAANSLTWGNVSVGLAAQPLSSNLSTGKIYALVAMSNANYQASKQLLGIGYDYYIVIKGSGLNITIGQNPATGGAVSVYVQNRNAFINGAPVTVQAIVWTKTLLAVD